MSDIAPKIVDPPQDAAGALKECINGLSAELEKSRQDAQAFRAYLNHEVRSGLNSILGFAQLLHADSREADRERVEQIIKSGHQLLSFVEKELGSAVANTAIESDAAADFSQPAGSAMSRVLYIEDRDANFALVRHILQSRESIALVRATSGATGLRAAREEHPRLVLLDLNLPDIHGSEVLRQLQASEETAEIPVVVISADATPSQIERLLAAGARNYLTKPFSVDEFLAVVDDLLQEQGQRA